MMDAEYRYCLKIAEVPIMLLCGVPVFIPGELRPFLVDEWELLDPILCFLEIKDQESPPLGKKNGEGSHLGKKNGEGYCLGKKNEENSRLGKRNEKNLQMDKPGKAGKYGFFLRSLPFGGQGESIDYYRTKNRAFYRIRYPESLVKEGELFKRQHITGYLGLEMIMASVGAFWIHGSLVVYKGKGIVFSGPSGIGKSTQASLWRKYAGAKIINGDRVLIRCDSNGAYMAYGSPYAGSSKIYVNLGCPLAGIYLLEKGKKDKITLVSGSEALLRLYEESLHDPGMEEEEKLRLKGMIRLVESIPVKRLVCTVNPSSVMLVKEDLGYEKIQGEIHDRDGL